MRPITHIVVHCSATPEGRHHTVDDLRRWHKQRGWKDVGYHYVVLLDGTIQKGRDEAVIGAHVEGHNSKTIGVCYIGGVDGFLQPKDTRTPEQRAALLDLLCDLKAKYPKAQVVGHNYFTKAKACPAFPAKDEYASI